MEIRLGSLVRDAREAQGVVLIIDVFRAFTTAAIAFNNGAKRIVLVAEIDEARALKKQGYGDTLMGEVNGKRPEGFDFGNSPYEVSTADFTNKSIIQSTRAGTVGAAAATQADSIYVTSFAIADATVTAVLSENPQLVSIIAMGDHGKVRSDEDEQCGIYLRNRLEGRNPDHDSIRNLILTGGATQKFFDDKLTHYHPKDVELALQINRFPFAIKVSREQGILVAQRLDV
ncbi:MAG: 2-phosphosulfolactate phosphatase [Chloroflexota bacterium]|nr:2-phosphosulfolactate phosphatase [Chloroflexota bacterium]